MRFWIGLALFAAFMLGMEASVHLILWTTDQPSIKHMVQDLHDYRDDQGDE